MLRAARDTCTLCGGRKPETVLRRLPARFMVVSSKPALACSIVRISPLLRVKTARLTATAVDALNDGGAAFTII